MKIYYFILYLSVQQILVQAFCPTDKLSLIVPKKSQFDYQTSSTNNCSEMDERESFKWINSN